LKRNYVLVIVTVSNREEADKIAYCLLDKRLIACVNIIGPVCSLYRWNGKMEKANEHVLLMKSRSDLFRKLAEMVKSLHDYEVPEIIALPITKSHEAYLKWLDQNLER
jgi:periplasmic divalent cation tolerance protein